MIDVQIPEPTEKDMAIDVLKEYRMLNFWGFGDSPIVGLLRRLHHSEAELKRLQGMIDGFAKRITEQSELLSRRAEKES